MGGVVALAELRKLKPDEDICLYTDTENLPYGTKGEQELLRLVKRDIQILKEHGAERILMACCTASTVYEKLTEEEKKIAVPIITPTAREAVRLTENGRIGVIATDRTVKSRVFSSAILRENPSLYVRELSLQPFVKIIEDGTNDTNIDGEKMSLLKQLLTPLINDGIDTLILGCTHFPMLKDSITECFGKIFTVSSPREGAKEIARKINKSGCGKTVQL